MGDGYEPVELYGIIEIATALGVDRRKVAVWHGRGKLPVADFRASGRPFWKPETITPWLATHAKTGHVTAPEPAAAAAGQGEPSAVVDHADQADELPSPTPASAPATAPPSSRSRRPARSATPARPGSRARSRRASAVDQARTGAGGSGDGGGDPYELVRSSQGWTLTYLGEPIGTVRAAWSATGRSKRWQPHSLTGTRLDTRTYPTVQAAAVHVAQAHRRAAERRR